MPLLPGKDRATIEHNFHELKHYGKRPRSRKQQIAIVLAKARRKGGKGASPNAHMKDYGRKR